MTDAIVLEEGCAGPRSPDRPWPIRRVLDPSCRCLDRLPLPSVMFFLCEAVIAGLLAYQMQNF